MVVEDRAPISHIIVVGAEPAFEVICREACMRYGWELLIIKSALDGFSNQILQQHPSTSSKVLLVSQENPEHGANLLDYLDRGADAVISGRPDPVSISESIEFVLRNQSQVRKSSVVVAAYTTVELVGKKLKLYFADELQAQRRLNAKERRKLELAFQEAVTNSVEHGNLELDSAWRETIDQHGHDRYSVLKAQRLSEPYYSQRKIVISFQLCDDSYFIRVRDEGPGFNPPLAGPSPQPTDGVRCSGRGIPIIRSSVDVLTYSHGGREICMRKHVPLPSESKKGCHGT